MTAYSYDLFQMCLLQGDQTLTAGSLESKQNGLIRSHISVSITGETPFDNPFCFFILTLKTTCWF